MKTRPVFPLAFLAVVLAALLLPFWPAQRNAEARVWTLWTVDSSGPQRLYKPTIPGVAFSIGPIKSGIHFDVEAFGAVADSAGAASANDAAFAAALAAMGSSGGVLYVPPKGYYISTAVDFGTRPVRLVGGATGATNAAQVPRLINTRDGDAIRVYNLDKTTIEHLSITSTVGTPTAGAGIHLERSAGDPGAVSAVLHDVYVSGHYYGFHIVRGVLTRVSNCTAEGNKSHGFYYASTAGGSGTSITTENTFADGNGGDGYYVDGYSYLTFLNTASDANSLNGYSLNKDHSANPTGITFVGIGAENNTLAGVKLTNGANITAVTFHGGLVTGSGTDGIQTNNAIGVTLFGTKVQLSGDYGLDAANSAAGNVGLFKPHFSTNTSGDINDPAGAVLNIPATSNAIYGPANWQIGYSASGGRVIFSPSTVVVSTSTGEAFRASSQYLQVPKSVYLVPYTSQPPQTEGYLSYVGSGGWNPGILTRITGLHVRTNGQWEAVLQSGDVGVDVASQAPVEINYTPQTAEASTTEGTVAYADSTNWDPGSGKGLYVYTGAAWEKLN